VTGWVITDATPADAAPLACILGDWIREVGWMPLLHSREEDQGFIGDLIANSTVWVARDDQGVIGFLAMNGAVVPALHLAKRGRGHGIGKALLSKAKACQPELSLWAFQANEHAIRFYLREGFREVERTDGHANDEGLPDIRLVWRAAG
jgi:GNAT superfamily N-acetyltransferase